MKSLAMAITDHFGDSVGEWMVPEGWNADIIYKDAYRQHKVHHFDDDTWAARIGKKNAGRLLDGREWNEMPERV